MKVLYFFSIFFLEVINIETLNQMFNEIIDELTLKILETKRVFKDE